MILRITTSRKSGEGLKILAEYLRSVDRKDVLKQQNLPVTEENMARLTLAMAAVGRMRAAYLAWAAHPSREFDDAVEFNEPDGFDQ